MGHGVGDIGDACAWTRWNGCIKSEDFSVPGAEYETLPPRNGALCVAMLKKQILDSRL